MSILFISNHEMCKIFTTVYIVDNYDRTSPWETIARDRVRMKRRIEMTEKILSSILTKSHRDFFYV